MIDNIVMRKIQIEGEDGHYLMDDNGNIFDMQANFIGTANQQNSNEWTYPILFYFICF